MDSIEKRERNAKAIDQYYKREARLNKRADLLSQLFLVVLLAGFFIYFSTTVLILKSLKMGNIETSMVRIAHLQVILIMINFVLIKRSKRILIPFYIVLGFIIPDVYYLLLIKEKFIFYIFPVAMNIVAILAGVFIWKKNREYIQEKKNKWNRSL